MKVASRAARPHSLVIRLLIAQVAPLALFAIVVLAVGAWTAHRIVADNADRLLAGALQTIRETVSVKEGAVIVDVAPWALALLDGPERDAVFYNVREGDRLVTGYVELPRLPQANTQAPVFADLSVRGVPVRMAQQQLAIPGRPALVTVSVAQSLESRRASLRELYRSMLLLPSLLVILAALLRLAAPLPTGATLGLLHASACAWALAFGLYLWRFLPWMIRPRADAAAKPAAPMMKIVPAGPRRAP